MSNSFILREEDGMRYLSFLGGFGPDPDEELDIHADPKEQYTNGFAPDDIVTSTDPSNKLFGFKAKILGRDMYYEVIWFILLAKLDGSAVDKSTNIFYFAVEMGSIIQIAGRKGSKFSPGDRVEVIADLNNIKKYKTGVVKHVLTETNADESIFFVYLVESDKGGWSTTNYNKCTYESEKFFDLFCAEGPPDTDRVQPFPEEELALV